MSSKVNVRFLVILSTVLVGVFIAVAATAVIVLRKSAGDHYSEGMKLVAEGNYRQAERSFSKAVNKERTNIAYLEAWENALENMIPESRAEFEKKFNEYRSLQRELSRVNPEDVERAEEFLAFSWEISGSSQAIEAHRGMRSTADEVLKMFQAARVPEERWVSLRKYTALPGVEIIRRTPSPDAELRNSVKADLDAALAARPTDPDLARAMADWHLLGIRQMPGGPEAPAAKEAIRSARAVMRGVAQASPNDPEAMLLGLQAELQPAFRQVLGEEPMDQQAALAQLDDIADALKSASADEVDYFQLQQLWQLEIGATGRREAARTREVVNDLLAERPDALMPLRLRAAIEESSGQFEDAIATWQTIIELPARSIGIDGFRLLTMRDDGVFQQNGLAFERWLTAQDDQTRQEMLTLLETTQQALAQRLPSTSPRLLMSDARVRFARSDLDEARRLLVRYVDELRISDPQALRILSRIASARNNFGEARSRLESVLALEPTDIRTRLELAEVSARAGDVQQAIALYESVANALPNNQQIADRLALLRTIAGEGETGDPVQDQLLRAAQTARGTGLEPGDPEAALAMVNDLSPRTEPRIVRDRMQYLLMLDRVADARDALREGLAANPDDPSLARLRPLLDAQNPAEVSEALIDLGNDSPARKLVAKSELRRNSGNIEGANQLLEQALAAAPDDAVVVEASFRAALLDRRQADATRFADIAAREDMDGVGGASFRARQEMIFGDATSARRMLEQAVEQRPDSVPLLRLLAQQQVRTGQNSQAVTSLERALALRGNDASVLGDYASALVRAGRPELALSTLREREQIIAGDPRLIAMRLELESTIGNQDEAVATREEIERRNPDDVNNLAQLAALYIDASRYADAQRRIDRIRELNPGLMPTELEARMALSQGNLEGARAAFRGELRRLLTQSPDADAGPTYVALGRFLLGAGDVQGGIEALRTARRWDREGKPIERELAESLFRVRRFPEAAESFRTMIDAGLDDDRKYYSRRLAETLIRMGEFAEAETLLSQMTELEESELSILVLRAEAAQGRGETTQARELLDRATRLFPQSALAFQRRAALFAGIAQQTSNTRLMRDALQDLDTAVRLDPQNAGIRRTRAAVRLNLGEREAAFQDFAESARLSPSNTQLVVGVIAALIDSGEAGRAVSLADEIVQSRDDVDMLLSLGDAFASRNEFRRSRSYYERAWERAKNLDVARRYVRVLLSDQPKRFADVQQVITALGAEVETDASLVLARAEVVAQRGRTDLAIADVVRSFDLVESNPDAVMAWFSRSREVLGSSMREFTPVLNQLGTAGNRVAWTAYFRGAIDLDSTTASEVQRGVATLGSLLSEQTPGAVARFAAESLSRHHSDEGEHQAAADALLADATRFPEDWQLHNNIAYLLTERLDRASEALDHAERAASLNPQSPEILDTLGWTYAKLNRLDEAHEALDRALAQVGRTRTQAVILVHLAYVRAARGENDLARAALEEVRALARDGIEPDESYKRLAEETERRISSQG